MLQFYASAAFGTAQIPLVRTPDGRVYCENCEMFVRSELEAGRSSGAAGAIMRSTVQDISREEALRVLESGQATAEQPTREEQVRESSGPRIVRR